MAEEQKQLFEQIKTLLEANMRAELANLLREQWPSDIAEAVELLDNEDKRIIFDVLDHPISAEVLEKVDEATRNELFELLEDKELAHLLMHLDADDAADVLAELTDEESKEVLQHLPEEDADQIKDLMSYSEDSAGGIMDPVVVSVTENATVGQAINAIREAEIDEDFVYIFVVDTAGKFVGEVRIRQLITNRDDVAIKPFIETDAMFVRIDTDQEEVRNIFSKNDLIVIPVLDKDDELVGRITADRVIEVAEEEAAEDMYAMAGTTASELESVSVIRAARIRMTWLLPCLIGTAVTAMVLMFFKTHDQLIYVAVVAFVPMIAAISGNAGLQTSAIVVCGLATGDLAALRLRQVFMREVRIAFLVAICCGLIGSIICGFLPGVLGKTTPNTISGINVVFAFGLAMFSAIMVSTTLGLFLPFVFRKVGIDPAISSGPLVTTANDSISVTIYMTLAILLAS